MQKRALKLTTDYRGYKRIVTDNPCSIRRIRENPWLFLFKSRVLLFSLFLLLASGCDLQSAEVAPAGASPAIRTPIGPIPGPEKQVKLAANPYAQDPNAIAEGKRLFNWYNCAGCHGGRAGGGMGPSLRDGGWIYGGSDAHIFNSIAEGRANGMPSWGNKVPEGQIWKIVAYIKSMRTPLEPEPPTP
jgi:cytochrome c oxidase cbb3-type subunit III